MTIISPASSESTCPRTCGRVCTMRTVTRQIMLDATLLVSYDRRQLS
jgi:hypothetical protein